MSTDPHTYNEYIPRAKLNICTETSKIWEIQMHLHNHLLTMPEKIRCWKMAEIKVFVVYLYMCLLFVLPLIIACTNTEV